MTAVSNQTLPVSPGTNSPTSRPENRTEQEFLNFRTVLAEQYLAWTELPEEERIRHKYLQDHQLTEPGLDGLSPQDRSAHEEKIAELTKQPVIANPASGGASGGDALSRPVISLQSVLDLHSPKPDIGTTLIVPE